MESIPRRCLAPVPGLGLCSTCNCRGAAEVKGAAMHLNFWSIAQATNLLSTAVSVYRGDLWTLNYTKAVFGRGSAPKSLESSPRPFSLMGIHPPHSFPSTPPTSCIACQGRLVLLLTWYPYFLNQRQKSITIVSKILPCLWQWLYVGDVLCYGSLYT